MKSKYLSMFLLGFLSCAFMFFCVVCFDLGTPFITGFVSFDVETPSDWVSEENIVVFDDKVVLKVSNVTLSNYEDSGSMEPIFDERSNGIRVVPENENDISVGDIVSYRFGDILVVHRIVEKGLDEDGVYFIVKGDNNLIVDDKIRFDDIEYVTVGVIW